MLVLFFSFAPVVNAQLTQAQIEDAFYNALVNFSLYGDAIPVVSYPTDASETMNISDYLDASGAQNGLAYRFEIWMNYYKPFFTLLTNSVTATQLSDELNTLSEDHLGFLDYLGGYTYTDSSELRVHDDGLNELVSNMVFDAGGLGADMSSALSQLIGISQDLEYIRGQFEAEASLPVSNIVRDAKQSTEDEYEDALEDAMEEYDSIPLPTSQDEYQTDAADPDGPTSSDVFGNLDTSVSHSALLTLTTAPSTRSSSSIIPAIEVDFGRDPGFVSFCLRLNDLTDWFYPILGTLFLSLKGLGMWRVVRQASTFASAKGDLPNMHLKWDPF